MQLREFFSRAGRRLWIVALIPVIAMTFAGWRASNAAPTYTATATVTVTPPRGAENAAATTQAVDSFRSAITADAVIVEAADNADVPVSAVEGTLSSGRIGSSNLVELSYTGPERDTAPRILREASAAGQRLLFARQVAAAEGQRVTAQKAYDAAEKAMTEAAEKTGLALPMEEYRSKASEVTQLRVALVQADARDISTWAIEEALAQAEKELAELAEKVAKVDAPQHDLDRARDELADANDQLSETEALLAAATGPKSVTAGPVSRVTRTTPVIRAIVAAGVLGLGLAIALLAAGELLRLNSRPVRKAATRDPVDAEMEELFPDARSFEAPVTTDVPRASGR